MLFGTIIVVGILGILKQSGALSESAPTVGLGESRDELARVEAGQVDQYLFRLLSILHMD